MSLQEVFINNLRAYRKQKGLTQNQLTLEIDMGLNYINGVEQSKYFPQPDVIEKIAKVLGIRPMQLFDENGCLDNEIQFNRDKFVDDITTQLYTRLKADIRRELEDVLGK